MTTPPKSQREIVENPFIKPANKSWKLTSPKTLSRPISPPPSGSKNLSVRPSEAPAPEALPGTAAVEAGEASVSNHIVFWTTKLASVNLPPRPTTPQLPIPKYSTLFGNHAGSPSGSHFVIHQHDHPIAGTHYDLRLQCNPTSSISFAIMYGLPGDPNSLRLNRNATETRVHNLWNHLIETASLETGSMLIWDTGSYEVLPYGEEESKTSDSESEGETSRYEDATENIETEQEKLHQAFAQRKIRIRLHGTRLPPLYTIKLRLTKENNRSDQPGPPSRKRKRKTTKRLAQRAVDSASDADSESGQDTDTPVDMGPFGGGSVKKRLSSLIRHETPPPQRSKPSTKSPSGTVQEIDPGGSDNEAEDQEAIRRSNAYPGALNDIGSIHQRKWYLSMDRLGSGFVLGKDENGRKGWIEREGRAGQLQGSEKFQVQGREVERSVITGRLAEEVMSDEGVVVFVGRSGWRAVLE